MVFAPFYIVYVCILLLFFLLWYIFVEFVLTNVKENLLYFKLLERQLQICDEVGVFPLITRVWFVINEFILKRRKTEQLADASNNEFPEYSMSRLNAINSGHINDPRLRMPLR